MGFLINTDYNNQKILYNQGTAVNVGSPTFQGNLTINHNLGRIPSASVWYEAKPGRWYPLSVRQFSNGATFDYLELIGDFYLTPTLMQVTIRNSGAATICNVWVRIWLDT